ncbi:MAG: DNA polymerase/3'-5' exonuclease PolX [Gaiella sp.]|jgi:DNA polymerase (family 10)|uniref:DNA polymerase/3'-5' exonuclease PolX n=1 Tax=Gaiella sp. TaxID=2663207 RepID=UPI002B9A4391|nr:DNA polymerase/3'-5' exonuclease PolX [Gaiella sp.]
MPPLPRNQDVADALDELADVSEILGEQGFRVLAYRRAATRIRETGASVAELAQQGTAKELPGIGATIESKIVEMTETGSMSALEKRRAEVPSEVRQFLRLPGLGPKTAARIWRELGVTTLEELRVAAEQQRVRTLQGLGAKSEERILEALAKGFGPEPERRGLLGLGLPVVRQVVEELRAHPAAVQVSGAGSVRRGRETFRDLDVIATATDPAALIGHFVTLPWVLDVAARGDTKATVVTKQGLRIDLRVVPPEDFGSLLQHFTGSKDHNVGLREEAQRRGLSISEYGVTVVETGEVHRFADEDDLYRFLGYEPIPPELRESSGELQAARNGSLPALVEVGDLVGELHCHSDWSSDGKASIEEMARTAKSNGYRFLALTDHSHYLREGRMEAQWREIDEVNARVKPFKVLRGVEANIRADGAIDVDDELLAELDWVVASLHHAFDKSPTERILAAIDHPHVDCIGHLTGRKLNRRAGADVDIEQVVTRAVETKTALEINSQPDRLDMRDVHARLAGEAGVRIPVTTDAHSTGALGYRELGVAQARRAWLTKEHVLNTRPWREIAKLRS